MIPESPACIATSMIWITNRSFLLSAICVAILHCQLQWLHCRRIKAMLIVLLHTLRFPVNEIHPMPLLHFCLDAKHQPSTNYTSLRWYLYQTWHFPMLVETSVSNGTGLLILAMVIVRIEHWPTTWFGSPLHTYYHFGYSSIDMSQPIWIGWVVSGLSSGSICGLI